MMPYPFLFCIFFFVLKKESALSVSLHWYTILIQNPACESRLLSLTSLLLQGCSSPLVVKLADTQRDKEQRRLQQQLVQQIQQLNNASTWGNLAGLGTLTPQYLAVSVAHKQQLCLLLISFCGVKSGDFSRVIFITYNCPKLVVLYFFSPQQLLQQATSTTNQGSFNGLQRLGSEFTFSYSVCQDVFVQIIIFVHDCEVNPSSWAISVTNLYVLGRLICFFML